MAQRRPLLMLLAALGGASLGYAGVVVGEREALEAGPSGWQLVHPAIPARLARLAGPPLMPGQGWPLDSYGRLVAADGDAIAVRAWVPDGGRMELRLTGEGGRGDGAALVISRQGDGVAAVMSPGPDQVDAVQPGAARRRLGCDRALPAPTDGWIDASLRRGDGRSIEARVGEAFTSCTAPAGRAPLVASVRSGLRRVGLTSLSAGGAEPTLAPGPNHLLRALGAGLCAAVFAVAAMFAPWVAAAALPLLLAAPLASADLAAGLQDARVISTHPLRWAVGLPGFLSAGFGLAIALFGVARRETDGPDWRWLVGAGVVAGGFGPVAIGAPGWAIPVALAAAAVGAPYALAKLGPAARWGALCAVIGAGAAGWGASLMAPRWGLAAVYCAVGGLLLGVLTWANARAQQVRAYNPVSLGLMLAALLAFEWGLVWTATGNSLVGVSSRAGGGAPQNATAWGSFDAIENTREFRDYPDQDYPVRPSPRDERVRVVALGGSSTAGAFQNDDISQFWPADVERGLGRGFQVVNQGVGGWTSLHMRRYMETQIDLVDPDVALIYMGHNDLLTESPRPLRDVYLAWKSGMGQDGVAMRISQALGRVRLYQGLRFGLLAFADRPAGEAVPVAHARANLQSVIDLVRARDGRVLLMREGVAPDPSIIAPYGALMAELAQQDGVAYLDAAAALADPLAGALFLDDCHLTRAGHERLAKATIAALQAEGWLER